jgi:hypothetical protein
MDATPLRQFLTSTGQEAEAFAEAHSLSPWSVRHWARGDKVPNLDSQVKLELATGGAVRPADWLAYGLAKQGAALPASVALA